MKRIDDKLLQAARFGHTKIVLALIEKGADVNSKNENGTTPLHQAAYGDHTDTAMALIEKGADVNAKNDGGETPLHWAVDLDNTETALAMIAHGADSAQLDSSSSTMGNLKGLSMLQAAARGGHVERLIKLLQEGKPQIPEVDPASLLELARAHDQVDSAAAIQAFMAQCAIRDLMAVANNRASEPG